uniref:Uncharacterized protein n=1 Tax=Oryza rufipogon TaxID=4529 RepID=A0A0E0NRD9_ORYRU
MLPKLSAAVTENASHRSNSNPNPPPPPRLAGAEALARSSATPRHLILPDARASARRLRQLFPP